MNDTAEEGKQTPALGGKGQLDAAQSSLRSNT